MNDQSLRTAASKLSLPAEVQEGALLAGRYRIGRVLGAGGMGAVLAAQHVELNEPVAIKVLLRDAAAQASPEAMGRFTREAWAASKIKSEYVARVHDLGKLDDGTPYIVMEYLDGIDLEELLDRHTQLDLEQALELMLQACEALAEAHALGIFHRDLKPSNLFCVERSDGVTAIKLLDFGISKIAPDGDGLAEARLTGTASTLGTPLYMSPEQMRSGRVADERSDIWALGVILYEMLLGRVPFYGSSLADLAVRIATELPASIAAERTDVPIELERVVMRCLEKDSARRFQSVAELSRALAPFASPRAAAHAERSERILQAKSARSMPVINTINPPQSSASTHAGSHARLRTGNAQTIVVKGRTLETIGVSIGIGIGIAFALLVALLAFVAVRRTDVPPAAAAGPVEKPAAPARETRSNAANRPPAAQLPQPRTPSSETSATRPLFPNTAGLQQVPPSTQAGAEVEPLQRSAAQQIDTPTRTAAAPPSLPKQQLPAPAAPAPRRPASSSTKSAAPTVADPKPKASRPAQTVAPAAPAASAPKPKASPPAQTAAPIGAGPKRKASPPAQTGAAGSSKDSELESLGGRL